MSSKKKPSKPGTEKPDNTRLSRGRIRSEAIFPVAPTVASLPGSYAATLQEIKNHIGSARIRAVLAANHIVIEAYWHTGKIILARQQDAAWGAKVIDRLAADLKEAFPDMAACPFATYSPREPSPSASRMAQLRNSLLHNYLGVTSSRSPSV